MKWFGAALVAAYLLGLDLHGLIVLCALGFAASIAKRPAPPGSAKAQAAAGLNLRERGPA